MKKITKIPNLITLPPSNWQPAVPEDFIGAARDIAGVLALKAKKIAGAPVRLVLHGAPGTGKTALANWLGRELAGHGSSIERANGKEVGIDRVRNWMRTLGTSELFGYSVKIINELDKCSDDAQVQLLSYADEMGQGRALIGTSNKTLQQMDERFQTRWLTYHVKGPTQDEIAGLLARFGVDPETASTIAFGCGGNVRAALLDAESHLDVQAWRAAA